VKIQNIQFPRLTKPASTLPPTHFSLIDLGADTIKIIVAAVEQGRITVLGHSLVSADGRDVAGGRAQAAALASDINEALQAAEDATEAVAGRKIIPDHALFLLPNRSLMGRLFTVTQRRARFNTPITQKELDALWELVIRQAKTGLAALPDVGLDWQPQTVTPAELRLDGHLVHEPVGLSGRQLALSAFGVTCQAAILRGIERLADRLELEIYQLVPAPQSAAMIVPARNALVLDVGASGTDCLRLRNDAIVAAERVLFGGEFFTRSLCTAFKCSPADGEALKIAFSANALSEADAALVRRSLTVPFQRWADEAVAAIQRLFFANETPLLPGHLFFLGGSAVLPGLKNMLLYTFREAGFSFARSPEVANLGETALPGYDNHPTGLKGILFAPVLSLAKVI